MSQRETNLTANKLRNRSLDYIRFVISLDIATVLVYSTGIFPIDSKMAFPIVAVNVAGFFLYYIPRKK
jgi:hypothetical protein